MCTIINLTCSWAWIEAGGLYGAGGTGKVDPVSGREYGPQDFFGVIDEMRIWKTVRTPKQIEQVRKMCYAEGLASRHACLPQLTLNRFQEICLPILNALSTFVYM